MYFKDILDPLVFSWRDDHVLADTICASWCTWLGTILVWPIPDASCGMLSLPFELCLLWWANWLVSLVAAMDVTFRMENHDSDGMQQTCYCHWSSPLCRRDSVRRALFSPNMHTIASNCILQSTRKYFLYSTLWRQPSLFTRNRTEWLYFVVSAFDRIDSTSSLTVAGFTFDMTVRKSYKML